MNWGVWFSAGAPSAGVTTARKCRPARLATRATRAKTGTFTVAPAGTFSNGIAPSAAWRNQTKPGGGIEAGCKAAGTRLVVPFVRAPPDQKRSQFVGLTFSAGFVLSRSERSRMICQSRKRIWPSPPTVPGASSGKASIASKASLKAKGSRKPAAAAKALFTSALSRFPSPKSPALYQPRGEVSPTR